MILLVIDVQKALVVDELHECKSFLNKVKKLINVARKNSVEVIFVQHDAGKGSGFSFGDEGFEIVEEVKPVEGEKIFVKTINTCFGNKDFSEYLKQRNEKELMVVGLQTDFCIDATIKSAFERGYKVYVPQGTNSTFDNDYMEAKKAIKYFNKWIWNGTFAECISIRKALEMLESSK